MIPLKKIFKDSSLLLHYVIFCRVQTKPGLKGTYQDTRSTVFLKSRNQNLPRKFEKLDHEPKPEPGTNPGFFGLDSWLITKAILNNNSGSINQN
jgi:hypothetical protein